MAVVVGVQAAEALLVPCEPPVAAEQVAPWFIAGGDCRSLVALKPSRSVQAEQVPLRKQVMTQMAPLDLLVAHLSLARLFMLQVGTLAVGAQHQAELAATFYSEETQHLALALLVPAALAQQPQAAAAETLPRMDLVGVVGVAPSPRQTALTMVVKVVKVLRFKNHPPQQQQAAAAMVAVVARLAAMV